MRVLLFVHWWDIQNWHQQLFGLLGAIATILLIILTIHYFFSPQDKNYIASPSSWRNPRIILSFAFAFGWIGFLLSVLKVTLLITLPLALAIGFVVAWSAKSMAHFIWRLTATNRPLDAEKWMESTGRVLEYIPSHRNGFGKVHLNSREAPYELEAITAGEELRPGMPVRVVDVIEDRVLLVVPAEDKGYPNQR
ncbi:MAG TPA: hypothetical protein PKA00_20920 [Saprospiraceae bacterium]|nr:hypothetical protein [Saprospiraceae bacterium]HMQ85386.1 hypothetical protein [Saprospiraceae bacterium]